MDFDEEEAIKRRQSKSR